MGRSSPRWLSVCALVAMIGAVLAPGAAMASSGAVQADVANAGWGQDPGRVENATWYSLLVNRNSAALAEHGGAIFVDLNFASVRCNTATNELVYTFWVTVENWVGDRNDLQMTATRAHYEGTVELRGSTRTYQDCAAPHSLVETPLVLGSVSIVADWVIPARTRIDRCTSYATPPPPVLERAVGWVSDGAQASLTLAGAVNVSFDPASQYTARTLSTSSVLGIPPAGHRWTCVPG